MIGAKGTTAARLAWCTKEAFKKGLTSADANNVGGTTLEGLLSPVP